MAVVEEPQQKYDALDVLGGPKLQKKLGAPDKLRAAVRKGLPYSAFEAALKEFGVAQKELGSVIGIPERTIARRKAEHSLSAAESDRLYRVARTLAQAASVLGSMEKGREWLKRANRALGNEVPLTLLDTDIGSRQVEELLLRVVYGIHS